MAGHPQRARPSGKSKTDLRRGHFTPGHPAAKKEVVPRGGIATTNAEQALLFGEPGTGAK